MPEYPAAPPEVLVLLAHPLRWQLVHALATSDRRVQELVESLQQPYNLVSYHLKLLRTASLVHLRKSDADGRDMYYSLDLDRLQQEYGQAARLIHPGWNWVVESVPPDGQPPLEVLFLCTHNSARSQMAEGLLRHLGGNSYHVTSAGSQPQPVHPQAIAAMREIGVDIRNQTPKGLDEFQGKKFDLVITVCDRVREVCPRYEFCAAALHWSIPDPIKVDDPGQQIQAFEAARDEIRRRIRHLLSIDWRSSMREKL